MPGNNIEAEELKLIEEARILMPKLPFDAIDLLIVDEMGKNLSGAGLDTNVIRRETVLGFVQPGPNAAKQIYVRSLHPLSYGNASGIGMADYAHDRLVRAIDSKATWINAMTALTPGNARVPIHFPTDRECIAAAIQTTGCPEPRQLKALWIKNTLSCESLLASEAYLDETRQRSDLVAENGPSPLAFDDRGDLLPVF